MPETTNAKIQIEDSMAPVARLNHDVWYLILGHVSDRQDLASLCRVCKELYPLATRALYRKITLGPLFTEWWARFHDEEKSDVTKWAESLALVRRLTADPDSVQTRAICEIDIEPLHEHDWEYEEGGDVRPEFEKTLPGFVKVLPNLRQVRVWTPSAAFEAFFRALGEHPNKPEIHLLKEDGSRCVSGPMPGVVTLRAQVNPWGDTPEKPNTEVTNIQKLFFACPDLKSFSISVRNNWGGCMRPRIHHTVANTFEFESEEDVVFPPLESLSFSGYDMDAEDEWPYWRDGLDWSRLKTLTLGPNPRHAGGPTMAHLLKQFKRHATALRSLTVQTWASEGHETCHPLNGFLRSFNTLEELIVKRHFVPIEKLAGHVGLKRLCLHCIEVHRPDGTPRPTLTAADLALLDTSCPELETLEIDISRDGSGQWPQDILQALAGSFSNLRRLRLHCEIGIEFDWTRQQDQPYLPELDEALVRAFAEPYFALRAASKVERITIHTGESLRRFPQWHPGYRRMEERFTRSFDAWLQSEDGVVRVGSSED